MANQRSAPSSAAPAKAGAAAGGSGLVRTLRLEDCVAQAEAAKEAGNVHFRAGDSSQALCKYREGLELVGLFREKADRRALSQDLLRRADAVFVALHLNSTQVCLKVRDWAGAVEHAESVLGVAPDSVKALYRRGVARAQTQSTLGDACGDFERVLELDPQNAEAREQLQFAREKMLTFYDLLGAHPRATTSQLRQAYLREAKRWHPDKAANEDKALATQRFKDIAEAHEVLRDVGLRKLYDLYLEYRFDGQLDVEDPDDPRGGYVNVTFNDWADFRRIFEGCLPGARQQRAREDEPEDPDDAPLSVWEWLAAGGALMAVWYGLSWRWSHRQWLKCLPLDIYYVHEEFSMPMALLMSPFFFGNVPWDDTVRWFRTMVAQVMT